MMEAAGQPVELAEHLSGPLDLRMTDATLPDAQGDSLVQRVWTSGLDPRVLCTSGHVRGQLYARGFTGQRSTLRIGSTSK